MTDAQSTSRSLIPLLIDHIVAQHQTSAPTVIGIAGPQGCGKTTLAKTLADCLSRQHALHAVSLSLDDFYKPKAQRQHMANTLHPLFATRGVPGTHDLDLATTILNHLISCCKQPIALPQFCKLTDERLPQAQWPLSPRTVDIILFEGWCLGATAQDTSELAQPINELERKHDIDQRWRHSVNDFLNSDYQTLFGYIDAYIMIKVDNFSDVVAMREQQEQQLQLQLQTQQRQLSEAQLIEFVAHFERITTHMMNHFKRANSLILHCDTHHRYTLIDKI